MLNLRNIIYIVFLSFVFGCGDQKSVNSSPTIYMSNTPTISETNSTKNVTAFRSIELIKDQIGDIYAESILSKDEKHVFVITGDKTKTVWEYSLIDYDISTNEPKKINTIVSLPSFKTIKVYPLSYGKLIYVLFLETERIDIYIYDYILKQKIDYHKIAYPHSSDFYIDPDEKYIMVEDYKIVINNLLRTSAEEKLIERLSDRIVNVAISENKKYAFVIARNVQIDNGHNLEFYELNDKSIQYISRARISTFLTSTELLKILELPNNRVAYIIYNHNTSLDIANPAYWVSIYDYKNKSSISTEPLHKIHDWDDAYVSYNGDFIYFRYHKYYIDISNIYQIAEILE